jgi:peptide/nickel transport system substrate-binding protein
VGPSARVRAASLAWLIAALVLLGAGWIAFARPSPSAEVRTYVEGVVGRLERINPLFARPGTADADLVALLFSGLTRLGPDGTPLPDLAESWEITPDALTYTFHLRAQVFWHDGEPLTAGDVAFTVTMAAAEGLGGPPELAAGWSGITTMVVDDQTIVMRLPAPSATFLARASLGIVPRHLLEGLAPEQLARASFNLEPVGTGPFFLETASLDRAILVANPSYHRGPPGLAAIELRLFADETARARAIARREIDAALLPDAPHAELGGALREREDLTARVRPVSGYDVLYLNNQRAPLDRVRVRRAIALALDRAAITDEVFGGRGQLSLAPVPPTSWAAAIQEPDHPVTPAPERVAALLDEAGWPRVGDAVRTRDGQPLALELVTNSGAAREAMAAAVSAQLAAVGIDVEVVTMPSAQLLSQRLDPRDYELAIFGWDAGLDPDPYGAWHTSQLAPPGRNFAGFTDPEADALLEAGRATLDTNERVTLYARFSQRFADLTPAVVLRFPAREYAQPVALAGVGTGLLVTPAARFAGVFDWRYVE